MVSLNPKEESNSNTKLEPIAIKNHNHSNSSTLESILKSPTENIKARLSSAEKRDVDHINISLEKINLKQQVTEEESLNYENDEEDSSPHLTKSSTFVNKKLNPLLDVREKAKKIDNDEVLGEYYKDVLSSMNRCNTTIHSHKVTLEQAKEETDELIKKLKETDRITTQLKNTNFIADKADDMVTEILKEEFMFQRQNKMSVEEDFLVKPTDRNGNETQKEPKVTLEEKRKLLETLKAIDDGEAVDISVADVASRKSKLMRELFGSAEKY